MSNEVYYMTKLDGGSGIYGMRKAVDNDWGIYEMRKIDKLIQIGSTEWVRIRRVTFSSISFVLNTSWNYNTPGDYTNATGRAVISWANQVKVVPIGGYHTVAFGTGTPYGIGLDLKTQTEVISWSFDQNGNGIPDQMTAVAAEATAYLMGKQPAIMPLGYDKTIAWGCGDNPITDNGDTSIQFDIYASV